MSIYLLGVKLVLTVRFQMVCHFGLNSTTFYQLTHIIQIYSGNARGGVLNGKLEFYAQKLQTLSHLYLFTVCFMKICLQSLEQITQICSENWREIFMKSSL